ncbi:unannotated protein [freshwater metagenome]|uniref:Unannotated protein n=1 Tax=freshwater metagenome TaxID=449393 RepID=A0A6J7G441_9ZZZZ|nr:hypothetical protein [Actinomycetota bacterium]MSW22868.1 hypothetical protein [Actinomycetota bacterium]MSX04404.1 hypothetical protein [Actinomycetota bacterium]MSX61109.1 hypothetical protein [Actinomycetota bacterium]MSX84727.1 hypothetical protein [Actinomycetota bacterium]
MRISPQEIIEEDDVTFLAGWMYADLFLAMMVVFLATISFIPEYFGNNTKSTPDAYNFTQIYKKPMIATYEGFNGELIAADIRAFILDNNLPPDTEIVYAQIVGSYNKGVESSSQAIFRAQQFSTKMDMSNIDLLYNASTTFSSTTSVPANRVVVKFTFASNIGVKGIPQKSTNP